MTPKKLKTRPGTPGEARTRRLVAEKYLEVADLAAEEDGVAINVAVGLAVLAGIAAGDAICLRATGELKPASHYGARILTPEDRLRAMRHANALVQEAPTRTTWGRAPAHH